jgi:hypothetical protein
MPGSHSLAATVRVWTPNRGPQAAFLACPLFEVLYGGAAGGGKSDALLMDALRQIKHPKYRAILFRKSYPDLEELVQRSQELYPAHGGRWNEAKHTWKFPSGALIKLRYISRDADVLHYQGHQYQWIGWDELTHFTLFQYLYMFSRCRATDPGLSCFIRASTNPGGPGHNWVHARFIEPAAPLQVITEKYRDPITKAEKRRQRVFIPAKLRDNPYLAATDYGVNLLQLPEADQKALLHGDWHAYVGRVFQLRRGVHYLTWAQFREYTGLDAIPPEWTRFTAMDWGFAKPFSIGWYAVDYTGRLWKYREWYGCARDAQGRPIPDKGLGLLPAAVADKMLELEAKAGETIAYRIADPSIKQKPRGDMAQGPSVQEQFAEADVLWDLGDNDRPAGKMLFHKRCLIEEDGFPGLIFISDGEYGCQDGSLRTIPALEYDPHRGGEDVLTTMEDHAYDETRYGLMSRPEGWEPRIPEAKHPWLDRQEEDWRTR